VMKKTARSNSVYLARSAGGMWPALPSMRARAREASWSGDRRGLRRGQPSGVCRFF
jgi:hypothetical protein